MFLLISGSHIGAPKRYSYKASPYKGAWNVSANNSEAVGHKDLVFYKHLIFLSSSIGRFPIYFLLRDSENYIYRILV